MIHSPVAAIRLAVRLTNKRNTIKYSIQRFLYYILMYSNETDVNSTVLPPSQMLRIFQYLNVVFYVSIFLLGVIGNVAVCCIIARRLRQSATSIFLLNLSMSDMMMALFCVPITLISDCLLHHWIFGKLLCHIFPFIQGVSVFLSALTHTAISVDRYFVVFHPLRRQNFPIKRAFFVVISMWIFSFSASCPLIFVSDIKKADDKEFCREDWFTVISEVTYSLVVMVLQYFLPVVVIVLTYSAIAVRIWFYQTPGESIRSRDEAIATSKKKVRFTCLHWAHTRICVSLSFPLKQLSCMFLTNDAAGSTHSCFVDGKVQRLM